MKRRGWSLIEMVVGIAIMGLMLLAMYGLFSAQATAQTETYDMTNSALWSRGAIDVVADHLRDAQMCTATSGCVQNSALNSGAASDVTYYSDSTGTQVRYQLTGTNLTRTTGGVTTTVVQNVTSLTLTYYTATTYNSSTLTACASPSAPTSAELLNLAAIRITASTTTDGRTVQYSTLVRLRNSPKRTNLKGN